FGPPDTLVGVSMDVEVSILVDAQAQALKTLDISFTYDPTLLEFVEATQGRLFVDSGDPIFFAPEAAGDSVRAVESVLGPDVSVDGPGEILHLRFNTRTDGASMQTIQRAVLIDAGGQQLVTSLATGTIRIQ